ncbi:beta-N-acetylhexosaminidase [Pseudotenacibaculum haliotis]|uniref:beta-N-acetylhexosaminidase n=1 Tax=Pseudotenacibaculum haliotis TaxID=1862138 RepID=A0ABW5LP51_9FLAO
MKHPYYLILFIALFLFNCQQQPNKVDEIAIIPKPLEQSISSGNFVFESTISLKTEIQFASVANYLTDFLKSELDITTKNSDEKHQIVFSLNDEIDNDEGYELSVTPNQIHIQAKTKKGAFYAVQSLLQLFPVDIDKNKTTALPCVEIKDKPQFRYRGMHLDVGRHFYSVDFIKKYIDLISRLKMNTFHWHLTEDQGWRIEIKKYPKLQEVAAFRKETLIGHYSDQPHKFDGKKYGGYYTQEQIKDIVAYAQQRQVTVIPEIEMPGHSQAAIAAYPELGCTGKQVEVATKWGIFEEVYCPSESTFKFLEDVIDEVITLFPGKYIHIGGDEAPKTRWKNCSHCQKLIKKEGLKDEHGLQSYFIQRMEKYINSKGKQIIGWDEILEGGLAPNATVMSWRGVGGAVQAAKEGHDVILTPTSHCYFDYYQSDNEKEPTAIGGFLPLEKVYSFNPVPKELTEDEAKYVLGGQGNVWTEYIPTSQQVEYMTFPRAIALSEVLWSTPEHKNYNGFINRLEQFQRRLDHLDVNYANHIYEVKGKLQNHDGKLTYELSTVSQSYSIYYSTDGSEPTTLYKSPIPVDASMNIKAVVKNDEGKAMGYEFEQKVKLHKGVGAKISINKEPHPSYNAGGKEALVNGISGNNKRYGDKEWLGFWGEDIEITIEFDKPTEINSISTRFHNGNGQWIYAPVSLSIEFNKANESSITQTVGLYSNKKTISDVQIDFSEEENLFCKSIRLIIPNYGIIPEGKQGGGNKAWTFIDEIVIE